MKPLFFFCLIVALAGYQGRAQSCEQWNGKEINCTDSQGQKQGYWREGRKYLVSSGHMGLGSEAGCQYVGKFAFQLLAQGKYQNNKRIGEWDFFSDGDLDTQINEKKVVFEQNGTAKENNYKYEARFCFSPDSSTITGAIPYKSDTLELNCRDFNCRLTLANQVISTFPYKVYFDLEYELIRLRTATYSGRILEIKSKQ